jgi:RecB family exonuclease
MRRAARKELAATARQLLKLRERLRRAEENLAAHDPTDYEGLIGLGEAVEQARAAIVLAEDRWLELAEAAGEE